MSVFMDHAETLGIRPVLEMIASHYASRYYVNSKKQICTCIVSPFYEALGERRAMMSATHDITCPVHRLVVICGSAEDLKALVDKSESFALELVRIVREPALETVQDFEYAKTIVGEKP